MTPATLTSYIPALLYVGGRFEPDRALIVDSTVGRVLRIVAANEAVGEIVRLPNHAILPGLINAHSHSFQRVIRGRTEHRSSAHTQDSFWTWREAMYKAALRLSPEDVYDAARQTFLEMLLAGCTTVGEFHYLHNAVEGTPYDDPNLLAKQVARAAQETGIRIALLRVAYFRAGFEVEANRQQRRFIEPDAEVYLQRAADLQRDIERENANANSKSSADAVPFAWFGVAPHSIRAVTLEQLKEINRFAHARKLPLHIHAAEQPAELAACRRETGRTPVQLFSDEGLLNERFTAIHAVHITPEEARQLGQARANVCACPTTERNLGDGIVPAALLLQESVSLALGSDSHTQIDILEDARELEYHLRLAHLSRAVLPHRESKTNAAGQEYDQDSSDEHDVSRLAARMFECATVGGARSLGASEFAGELAPQHAADFFTVDLNDPTVAGAGAEDLLAAIVFSASRASIKDCFVGGQQIITDGKHAAQEEIVARFVALQNRLWRQI